jgi:hypothetical protein
LLAVLGQNGSLFSLCHFQLLIMPLTSLVCFS